MIFKRLAIKAAQFVIKNKGIILSVGAGVFEIGAIVTASKQSIKAEKIIAPVNVEITELKKEMENTETGSPEFIDNKKKIRKIQTDTFVKLVKVYSVPTILTLLSLTCIGGSYKIMHNRQIALTGAYMTLEKSFQSYRDRVKAELGEDKEKDIYQNASYETKQVVDEETGEVRDEIVRKIGEGGTYELVFDETCKGFSRNGHANYTYLMTAQQQLNLDLCRHGYVFLIDVIDALGMDKSTMDRDLLAAARVVGWLYDPFDSRLQSHISLGISNLKNEPNEIGRDLFNNAEHVAYLTLNPDGIIAFDRVDSKTGEKIKGYTHYLKY